VRHPGRWLPEILDDFSYAGNMPATDFQLLPAIPEQQDMTAIRFFFQALYLFARHQRIAMYADKTLAELILQ
jgi:hypothetical protein